MEKIIIFVLFISLFIFLIRKDVVYFIPMIFLFYTNINGLLDWEDFAKHGVIKFPDYGFLLSTFIVLYFIFLKKGRKTFAPLLSTKSSLLLLIIIFILYYIFLFFYSITLQGSLEWPIKIGRKYLYSISVLAFYMLIVSDPVDKFRKVISFLEIYTILFSVMYIVYNYFNINFYADQAYDIIDTNKGVVNRNFAAFPYFLMYFYCFSLINFLNRKGNVFINLLLIFLYLICMISVLTRGMIITAGIIFVAAFVISENRKINIAYILVSFGVGILFLNYIHFFQTGNFLTLLERSSEIGDVGIANTGNFEYRTIQFFNIFNNVVNYNPLFGFGFMNTNLLGYHFNNISAGSPDNGFTNLLGISGFVGLTLFMVIIIKWALLNIKLQRSGSDNFSKVHFLFVISILLSLMNGSSNSYLESFGLFLVYDLLIYREHLKLSE